MSINDSSEMADKLITVLNMNGIEKTQIKITNRQIVLSKFSITVWVDQVIGIYNKVLKID